MKFKYGLIIPYLYLKISNVVLFNIDYSHSKYNKVISPETKYMRLMEAIEETQRKFLRARRKGETLRVGIRQSKISSKDGRKWKNIN